MSLSLSDMNKDVLSVVIKAMYPSIDDMVDITLNTLLNFDDVITNLKFLGADDIDSKKIMEAYEKELRKTNVTPSPCLAQRTSDDIPGMDDIEDEDCIPNSESEAAFYDKVSTSSHPSTPILTHSSRSSSQGSTYLTSSEILNKKSSNNNSSLLPREISVFDESRDHSEHSFDSLERNQSPESFDELKYTTPTTVNNKNTNIINDFKEMKISTDLKNQDSQWEDNTHEADEEISNDSMTTDDDSDSLNGIDETTFHQYLDFLQMSFPNIGTDVIIKTLKECNYDPTSTSDQLLNINAINSQEWSHLTESSNNIFLNESNDDSNFSNDKPDILFLVNSFPDMSKDVIKEVYESTNHDLIRSSDELLTLQMFANDPNMTEISTENDQQEDLDPIAFLKMSFPQITDKQIMEVLESNGGDVMLASDELLSAEMIVNFKEEMQLHHHLQNLAEAELNESRRKQASSGGFQTVRSRRKRDKINDESITFLMNEYDLDKKSAQVLYENSNGNLFNAVTSILDKTSKKQPVKHSRLLTSLEMKVQRPGEQLNSSTPSFRGYKPNSAPVSKPSIKEPVARPSTAIDVSSTSKPSSSESNITSNRNWNDMNIQDLVDEEKETRMAYMRRATEAYRKANSNPLFRTVAGHYMNMARQHAISNNARLTSQFDEILDRQTTEYSIDLHHLSVSYALDAARTKIENWWTKESSSRGASRVVHHLRIITGAGTHSVDNIPRIKNGVKKMLLEGNWNFTEHRAHFEVYGQKKIKKKANV